MLTRAGKSWRQVPGEQGTFRHSSSGPHALGARARRATLDSTCLCAFVPRHPGFRARGSSLAHRSEKLPATSPSLPNPVF